MPMASATTQSSGERGQAKDHTAFILNQHLAVLAGVHGVEHYLLYGHGQDLCHD
jgi:hypothetical protein